MKRPEASRAVVSLPVLARLPVVALPALLTLIASCNRPSEPQMFQARQAIKDGKHDKELGADCGEDRASGCKSGLCAHTQADPEKGWICSRTCQIDEDCPGQHGRDEAGAAPWRCVQVHPTPGNSLCLPPGPSLADGTEGAELADRP